MPSDGAWFELLRLSVKSFLMHPPMTGWSLQGLGMLRYYLSPKVRLHVWSQGDVVEEVSTLHSHPWDFESLVLSGSVTDQEFVQPLFPNPSFHLPLNSARILCGPGGSVVPDSISQVSLSRLDPIVYRTGQSYEHKAEDIHESFPSDGAVTIIRRIFKDDVDHANVYWPVGKEWVSAEPRNATSEEVRRITGKALEKWDVYDL